jgi:hypothetical protein
VGTVQTVKQTVEDTVGTVKDTVTGTVRTVQNTFDLRRQVEEHPWPMFVGSVAVGFLAGNLLPHHHRVIRRMTRSGQAPRTPYRGTASGSQGVGLASHPVPESRADPAEQSRPQHRGIRSGIGEQFAPEIDKPKSLAIGMAVGLVRDAIKNAVAPNISARVEEVIDGFTTKLGGEPIAGPVLASSHGGESAFRVAREDAPSPRV